MDEDEEIGRKSGSRKMIVLFSLVTKYPSASGQLPPQLR